MLSARQRGVIPFQPVRAVLCSLLIVALAACDPAGYRRYQGETMGTDYGVTAHCPEPPTKADIEGVLDDVNAQMSTYQADSEISRFNASQSTDWVAVSAPLARLVALSDQVSRESEGAFDITVGPLVNLWGFGPASVDRFPAQAELAQAQLAVGYSLLEPRQDPPALRKGHPDVYADVSAIAKGHAVDAVAGRLSDLGCTDYLIDIGGEVLARGTRPGGSGWRIGIEVPDATGVVQRILVLEDVAVATSGDYRNYIERDGNRVSHTIDPRTGAPVEHNLASVTVITQDATLADAYATAILVLGPEAGLAFAEQRELVALLLVRQASGFEERYTRGFATYLSGAVH